MVAVVVVAAGAAGAWALVATMPVIDLAPVEAVATPVIVFDPSPQPVARPWSGYGTAEALTAADVPARVTATVASLGEGVRDGAAVGAGQTLVTLERADFEDEVTRLESLAADADAQLRELDSREARLDEQAGLLEEDLDLQTRELERVSRLEGRSVATGQDVDRARSQVLAARSALSAMRQSRESIPTRREALTATAAALEAQLRVARRNLGRTTIKSPIRGYLQSLDVEAGEAVSPGQRVARVVDPAVVEVPLKLPAGARRGVRVGDPVELRSSWDLREREGGAPAEGENPAWTGKILRINPTDDAQTRTLTVYVVLDQADTPAAERLAPGLFVAGTVTAGEPTPRVVVPRRSLRRGRVQLVGPDAEGRPRVRSVPVSVDFHLRARLPGTGLPDDQWAVLDAPLPAGERVVLTANASLLDGQAVDPRDAAARGER
ncbi:putative efflux system periplasmic linker protein [Phycisphaera mikurensis NBRC 102666]|uniref:Putative efflux system periplasmic linker protein n=1 Tax=Phycisphaera mikurensis (strain NBRC 102666 / KCTC 22515 / FYK2301M01) TaxID=1142394 RepID=I0IIZ1_PHYMF|nr:putative efflux system periplasmic linker protein [Phycisphaera mikurensis NBRC 102666]